METILIPVQLIDDFGELSKLRAEFAPTEKLYQKLRKEIADLVKDSDANETFAQSGARFSIDISACGMQHPVDVKATRKKLGWVTFLKVCTVAKSALENFLVKPEIEALCVSSRTGPRSITAIPLDPAA